MMQPVRSDEKVNALREPRKGVTSHKGTILQSAGGEEDLTKL